MTPLISGSCHTFLGINSQNLRLSIFML
jgi:hypothetical protein